MKPSARILVIIILASCVLGQTLCAGLITGEIDFGGSVNLNTSSARSATAVTAWGLTEVLNTSGTFATPPYNIATGTAITFKPGTWNFSTTSPITNFWTVGGFKFELLSSDFSAQGGDTDQNGFVFVQGTGVVTGNGFTPTAFFWSFHTQDPASGGPPPTWTFSSVTASQNVNGAPVIRIRMINNSQVVNWSDPTFTLQAAPTPSGTYTNVPGATSPYTNNVNTQKRFFRLNQ